LATSALSENPRAPRWRRGPAALARMSLLALIKIYQWGLSPWFGGRCRYLPSCSVYAAEAVRRFGALRGGWLALKRLGRCHPWGGSGYDPVPEADEPSPRG
jgi:uncharacterized protein